MRYHLFFIVLFSILSCQSSDNEFLLGTTGARYGINPFPEMEQWVDYLNKLKINVPDDSAMTMLWVVGTYYYEGVKLGFPGEDAQSDYIYYSNIDYNEEYLAFFDKNNIEVFLLIEPGFSPLDSIIDIVLNRYGGHTSVKGVCLDLEWYNNLTDKAKSIDIQRWLERTLTHRKSFKLMLKHWNIKRIEPFLDNDIIYIQSMHGISKIDDLKKRHSIWVRKFYPCHIGMEIGFSDDRELWSGYKVPILGIYNEILELSTVRSSLFWNESTLLEYLEKLEAIK